MFQSNSFRSLLQREPVSQSIRVACSLVAAFLLASAFPPLDQSGTAWFAMVPLLMVARFSAPAQAFRFGMLSGFVFWTINLAWLRLIGTTGTSVPLAIAAWIFLSLYCSVYTALFAMIVSRWFRSWPKPGVARRTILTLGIPVIWVGLEYIRSEFMTGFPWNTLAVSQNSNLPVCQIASFGGVYMVSALVMLVNSGVTMTIFSFDGTSSRGRYQFHPEIMAALLALALSLAFGIRILTSHPQTSEILCVATIQPNVEQTKKWSLEWADRSLSVLSELTRESIEPDLELIVWPETATPSPVLIDPSCIGLVESLLTNGVPILVGSMILGHNDENFNGSILFQYDSDNQVYIKQHLIPFGEYVPLANAVPVFNKLAPVGWSCTPGTNPVVFNLQKRPDARFSVLICFEDVFPRIARNFVRRGARLLINQTNDAWFDGSSGASQHLANARFRCIENRVPCVRSANTGISCFIDSNGYISRSEVIRDTDGSYNVPDHLTSEVALRPASVPLTPYTRSGDLLFGIPCAAAVCAVLSFMCAHAVIIRRQKARHTLPG